MERADYAFQEYATFNWIHHLESLESYKLDSSRDETSNFRPALALLHQHYLEDNLHTGPTLGEEGKDIDISEELNAWKIAYERVEVLRQGDGLQSSISLVLIQRDLVTEAMQIQCLTHCADSSKLGESSKSFRHRQTRLCLCSRRPTEFVCISAR